MARRSDHSREEISQMAVQWIKEQLQHGSISQLSLRQVAKAIGYSPGTLINQFGSYSLLLLHVNALTLDELSLEIHSSLEDVKYPKQRLHTMGKSYLNFALKSPHAWRLIFEHRLDESEEIPEWQMTRIRSLFEQVKAELEAFVKEDALKKDRVEEESMASTEQFLDEAARVIWSGVHGISLLAVEDKLFEPVSMAHEQLIESLIENYIFGWLNNQLAKQ